MFVFFFKQKTSYEMRISDWSSDVCSSDLIYTVELYREVRVACGNGMTQREAARHFNISRDSVRKMLSYSTPPGYRRQAPVRRPKLDAFVSTIDHWLDEDVKVPRKQRHTAKRVFDRLRDECGFTGGYTIIKDYMREREQRRQEVFVPLSHPPGHAQADTSDERRGGKECGGTGRSRWCRC